MQVSLSWSINISIVEHIHRFQSRNTGPGFKVMYTAVECDNPHCGSVCRDYSDPSGILTSPYFPKFYPHDSKCIYTISQPNNTYINLTISTFDVQEADSDGACPDYLEIRDGGSWDSPLIGQFCGGAIPSSLQSTQNKMYMR